MCIRFIFVYARVKLSRAGTSLTSPSRQRPVTERERGHVCVRASIHIYVVYAYVRARGEWKETGRMSPLLRRDKRARSCIVG